MVINKNNDFRVKRLEFLTKISTQEFKGPNYGMDGRTDASTNFNSGKKIFYCIHENEHCHNNQLPEVDKVARRKLIIVSVLCVMFMIAEAVGGYLSNSLAIATDAAHLLTDFASFMISLFSLWVSSRPATRKMSFGWYRAEVIGALTSVLLIWVVTGILVYLAIQRVISETFELDAQLMLITSAIGAVINLIMGLSLHYHGHSHTDSKKENINVRAALIHIIGDFIQSFGVLVAALIIFFKPTWIIVDPICTFLFSILVIITTFAIIQDTINVLMEGLPKGIDFVQVTETFLSIEGVVKVHSLRIWALSLDKIALSAHLAIKPGVNPQKILTTASKCIRSKYNFFEMTLQVEEFQDKMDHCFQCQMPEK
ncbi:zinc transporter, putative [Pediculus humanus corporis]|uniref:Zinc transporter, putative n=1 Tax=Pediculus humanus subsp. corporis TaxID=121224 RepID=E0VXQ7_PEDHC|nr:zinc transporter, putative [Pediculus humanus corporis]EEB18163.1 zinc transporter, putative [Pediculus humanus corporis]